MSFFSHVYFSFISSLLIITAVSQIRACFKCDAEVLLICKLQEYIHVLSRPMSAAKVRHNVWTNVYLHNMVRMFSTIYFVHSLYLLVGLASQHILSQSRRPEIRKVAQEGHPAIRIVSPAMQPWVAWLGLLSFSSVCSCRPASGHALRGVSERGPGINRGLIDSRIRLV